MENGHIGKSSVKSYSCAMKWALVLSGGGARGLAHIGVLEALEELHVERPSCIVGCSMGAVVGGLYASGVSISRMKHTLGPSFDVADFMGDTTFSLPNSPITRILRLGHGIKNMFVSTGLDSGERMYEYLLEMTRGVAFGHTAIPFYCNATDLCTGAEITPETGPIADAIRASASFPGVFAPVKKGEMLLADGYLRHNTPVWIARKKGYSRVLAVYLDSFDTISGETLKNPADVLLRAFDCALHPVTSRRRDRPTAYIMANSTRSPFDFSKPERQIQLGYEATMAQKSTITAFFQGYRGVIRGLFQNKEIDNERS